MELEFIVKDEKYFNIKEVLKVHFEISDRLLIKLKKNKKIYLNNTPAYVDKQIKQGDIIKIDMNFEEESENIIPIEMNLNIIFEDNYLLIINKPAGIPVHPSIAHYKNSLSNGVKYYFNMIGLNKKIRPVNRLDKDTSGIVIFAKHEYIQEHLIKQMKTSIFKKEYQAILTGHLTNKNGKITAPIARKDGSIIEREINFETGENAITYYMVLNEFYINNTPLSLVNFLLETGRTHQIRLHSKYLGNPIIGDTLYGKESDLINRQALHAYKISFIHPISKENIILEIDLPDDMKKIL
jgi:23S rRNA pseudouridine1911/1915/1917 synthase